MANGLCSNPKCLKILTLDNCCATNFKVGTGYCRVCATDAGSKTRKSNVSRYKSYRKKYLSGSGKEVAKKRRIKYYRLITGRHARFRFHLKKEGVPKTDPLWSLNFYEALLKDQDCHYCKGPIDLSGFGLDRVDNCFGHVACNVVPCCWMCNRTKGNTFSYDEIMILAPVLRKITQERTERSLAHASACANAKG